MNVAVPQALFVEVVAALNDQRPDLVKRLYWVKEPSLTSKQAAGILGVSSPNTIKNWLCSGKFPGAYQTNGGHWRFPESSVHEMKSQLDDTLERSKRGDLTPPEIDEDPPLL